MQINVKKIIRDTLYEYGLIKYADYKISDLPYRDFAFTGDIVAICISSILREYNRDIELIIGEVADTTDYRTMTYNPKPITLNMIKEEDYFIPDRIAPRVNVGIPLKKYNYDLDWYKRGIISEKTVKEIFNQLYKVIESDKKLVYSLLAEAFLNPVNRDFTDYLMDYAQFRVYALYNADGSLIRPTNEAKELNGNIHSHYLCSVNVNKSDLKTIVDTVSEHDYINNDIYVITNEELIGDVHRYKYDLPYVNYLVRDWIPENYIIVAKLDGRREKPLARRILQNDTSSQSLKLCCVDSFQSSLRAMYAQRIIGFSVIQRHQAAALYVGPEPYYVIFESPDNFTVEEIDIFEEDKEDYFISLVI